MLVSLDPEGRGSLPALLLSRLGERGMPFQAVAGP